MPKTESKLFNEPFYSKLVAKIVMTEGISGETAASYVDDVNDNGLRAAHGDVVQRASLAVLKDEMGPVLDELLATLKMAGIQLGSAVMGLKQRFDGLGLDITARREGA